MISLNLPKILEKQFQRRVKRVEEITLAWHETVPIETLSLTKEAMQGKFEEHFKEAKRLVQETEYHRRDEELKGLKKGE